MSERTVYVAQNGKAVKWTVPKRELAPNEVRVKVHTAAINPIDWKTIDNNLADGTGQGNDFAGTVVEVGSEVKSTKVGDTVAGGVAGGNIDDKEQGAFSNEVNIAEHLLFKFPEPLKAANSDHVQDGVPTTFEQAASLGIAAGTTILAFENARKPKPGSWAVIYGVTSSSGYFAAQYARNIGYSVIGISAPSELISGLGIEWFDRNDPEWIEKSKKIAKNNVVFAFDTICLDNSRNEVAKTVSTTAAHSTIALSDPGTKPDAENIFKNTDIVHPLWFFLLQDVKKFGTSAIPDKTETIKRAPELYKELNAQFAENEIRTLPIKVSHGLDKVNEGLSLSRKGVRASKVVIDVE